MSARPLRLWQVAILGPALIAYGIYEWWDLYKFEHDGEGTKRVGRITFVLYEMGGKNLVAAVTAGIGVLTVYLLVTFLRQEREANAKLAELAEREAHRDAKPEAVEVRDDDDVAKHPVEPPKGTPPRERDQPFRGPPVNIVVVPTAVANPAPAPVVAGDPSDRPKMLT